MADSHETDGKNDNTIKNGVQTQETDGAMKRAEKKQRTGDMSEVVTKVGVEQDRIDSNRRLATPNSSDIPTADAKSASAVSSQGDAASQGLSAGTLTDAAVAPTNGKQVEEAPKPVSYRGELNVELADEKLLSTLETLQCWGCRALVWNCQVPPCAHLACKNCVDSLYAVDSGPKKCPTCKETLLRSQWEPLSPDRHKFIVHLLYNLKIKCPEYQHKGCKAVIEYSDAKSHLDKTCQFSTTQCEFCRLWFKTCEMGRHGRFCKRWIKCTHCKKQYLSDQDHETKCGRRPIPCPNNCSPLPSFNHDSLVDHLRICPTQLVPCPVHKCPATFVPRNDLANHLNDVELHANALIKCGTSIIGPLCKELCLTARQLAGIHDQARMFPIAFCDKMHVMRFAVAQVSRDLPLCAKCAEQLEPRQPHFACDKCQLFHCTGCLAQLAVIEDGKARNEHWATSGLNPPAHELDFLPEDPAGAPRTNFGALSNDEAHALGQLLFGSFASLGPGNFLARRPTAPQPTQLPISLSISASNRAPPGARAAAIISANRNRWASANRERLASSNTGRWPSTADASAVATPFSSSRSLPLSGPSYGPSYGESGNQPRRPSLPTPPPGLGFDNDGNGSQGEGADGNAQPARNPPGNPSGSMTNPNIPDSNKH
jgi:hypothetical protein